MKVEIKRLNINNWQIYIDGKLVTGVGEIRTRQTAVFIAEQKIKGMKK